MKKILSLLLAVLLLGTLCLPAFAADRDVIKVLDKAQKKVNLYVQNFEIRCLTIPATISPVIFANITVEIDGEDVYLDSVLNPDRTEFGDDALLFAPGKEEYVEPIIFSLTKNFPLLVIEKRESAETKGTLILVSLPEMTKEMRAVCEKLLDAYAANASKQIGLLRSSTVPALKAAGGSADDEAALEEMCDDAMSRTNAQKDKYAEYIQARRELYLKEHPEDADESDTKIGSVVSQGNITIVCTVAAAVVFGFGGFLLGRKKKPVPSNSASAVPSNSASAEDDEE